MDYNFKSLINGVTVNHSKPNEVVVGRGDSLWLLNHDFSTQKLTLERSVKLGSFSVAVGYSAKGDSIVAATTESQVRVFDNELNLTRRYSYDDAPSALSKPNPSASEGHLGIDLIVGFDSGKIFAYDTRCSSDNPAFKIENHSNSINAMQCLNWWNLVSVGDDAYLTMHDFRSRKCRQEYGPMEGLPRNLCVCPISKKTVVCSLHSIYVFDNLKYDDGPILRADPPYKDRMAVSAVNLSTQDAPGVFGIGYLDSPYITILDTDANKWDRRYPTSYPNVDHFATAGKNAEHVYFVGEETHFCVRSIEDLQTSYDMKLDIKAGKRNAGKQQVEKKALNFSGLVSDDEEEVEDSDSYDDDDPEDDELMGFLDNSSDYFEDASFASADRKDIADAGFDSVEEEMEVDTSDENIDL